MIIIFIILVSLGSCTFQSNQYDFIKNIMEQESDKFPKKNWKLLWNNKETNLYAVNFNNSIIFTDGFINIVYKEWQIFKITGLLPNENIIEIESINSRLVYSVNGKRISDVKCGQSNLSVDIKNEYTIYSQKCSDTTSGERFENQVIIDPDGMISGLKFNIHPNYPSLQLSIE